MSSLVELCEKYFGSKDFYQVLRLEKDADDKAVRKAYHKISLLVHPDRVEESLKIESTEKFKVLGKIHSILSDKEKRKIYDETGSYDEEGDEGIDDWTDYWRKLFKPITKEDIMNYEKSYKGSDLELLDLKKAYLAGKGDMDLILELVPFTNTDDEPRLKERIEQLIKSEEVPRYEQFFNENKQKKARRKRKWAKEREEAERLELSKQIDQEPENDDDLVLAIQRNRRSRVAEMDNFLDSLAQKYGGEKGEKKKRASRKK